MPFPLAAVRLKQSGNLRLQAWWRSGGGLAPVAAWQGIGVSTKEASYINLANPGVNNLAEGNAPPVWDTASGWISSGSKYLRTGIVLSALHTVHVRFNSTSGGTSQEIVGGVLEGSNSFALVPRRSATGNNHYYTYGGSFETLIKGTRLDGSHVMTLAGPNCYLDGVLEGVITGTPPAITQEMYLGRRNGSLDGLVGSCQAAMTFDYIRNAEQVAADVAAMLAIPAGLPDAAWSFFGKPTTLHYAYSADKTYIGVAGCDANISLLEYNHSTEAMCGPVVLHASAILDDHNQPSILIRSDGKVMAFYAEHNGDAIYQRISANAESIAPMGAETSLDAALGGGLYCYPSPVQLTGEDNNPIYLFYRALTGSFPYCNIYYSVSINGGTTWAGQTALVDVINQRPYFQVVQNGTDRVDITFTDGHPNEVATNSVYHFYYQGGHYYKSDGTDLGDVTTLPLAPADVTKVYDGTTVRSWVWDIATDGSGQPVIVYATFPTAASDHRYNYARWTGSAWDVREICAAGGPLYAVENYYSGGLCLDHEDVNTVYCSRNTGGTWEIWKYVTSDGGANWVSTQITSGSTNPNIRPLVPINHHAGMSVVWLRGRYTTFSDYNLDLIW